MDYVLLKLIIRRLNTDSMKGVEITEETIERYKINRISLQTQLLELGFFVDYDFFKKTMLVQSPINMSSNELATMFY